MREPVSNANGLQRGARELGLGIFDDAPTRPSEEVYEASEAAGVLHASASIFETMAKEIVGIDAVQDQTLASFFNRYRKSSGLPEVVLDYILSIYKRRNIEPLAGHGSIKSPTVTKPEAVILAELTKAFVRIERQLHPKRPT